MDGRPSLPLRVWRTLSGRNELRRPGDRLESVLVASSVLIALICIPLCATIGSEQVARGMERVDREGAARFPGTALVLEAPPAPVSSVGREAAGPARMLVTVTWPGLDGADRTGHLPVRAGTPLGAREPIWLDAAGNLVGAPFRASDALSSGILHGAAVWFAVVVTLAAMCWIAHLLLDRRRYAAWARDWKQFDPSSNHP